MKAVETENLVADLTFTNLVVGKIYDTAENRSTQIALYLQPFPDEYVRNIGMFRCIGTLKPNETFVLLGMKEIDDYFATKILTDSGCVGWTWWQRTTCFKQINE